ncbi:PhzF family phenazine biosynthesis protein [Chitinophaga nivalis]|uniref:PhzF family phenazine biosynthesis protein n=1 Tax=Chitinophaga nivalis TaxID=2991709 RepID=A0ABT3IM82_9BACT|nr:PhzF family phenazine biosynthesis protein [Chitinophaga nivalis]MCW3465245.1 PhzF family phenazine biosynthesis protein [Chitinophaga nivalis]MCW3485063.1 PhzF family phenazine biosynthesis protein [Chitinophaga nivalis]
MQIPFFQVDAFTNQPFKGNPAAVCLLESMPDDQQLQHIAAENNLAETAFILPLAAGYQLRWFTPVAEVSLCGHATLASAHVLWESGRVPAAAPITFHTLSGPLTAIRQDSRITLNFPARGNEPVVLPANLQQLFGNDYVHAAYSFDRYIVELSSGEAVAAFKPDRELLGDVLCVVTGKAAPDSAYDFVSRFFAVPIGVDEDPVTGSAHCSLAPYWAERLQKNNFLAYQASARGGELQVVLDNERVFLSGEAVTIINGTFHL